MHFAILDHAALFFYQMLGHVQSNVQARAKGFSEVLPGQIASASGLNLFERCCDGQDQQLSLILSSKKPLPYQLIH